MTRIFLLALIFTLAHPLHAANVDAEGIAFISDSGLGAARQNAIRDAIGQASLQLGVQVSAADLLTPEGLLIESSRVRPTHEPVKVAVLREWRDQNYLHVLVRAEGEQSTSQAKSHLFYKKKVLVLPFHVYQPNQVSDVDDIWNGFPRELVDRLENSNKVIPVFSKYGMPLENKRLAHEPVSIHVKQLAIDNNCQFVIIGEVVDAGINTLKEQYFEKKTRRFEIQVLVYDGLTGTLLTRHKLSKPSEGNVVVGADKPFGSEAFFSTVFGNSVDAVLNQLTTKILNDLEHLPFTARIVRISDRNIFFDAGATSLLAPGDNLAVYRKKDDWLQSGLKELGVFENPVASVSVTQVQPLFSVGELSIDPGSIKLRTGDLVRFISSD